MKAEVHLIYSMAPLKGVNQRFEYIFNHQPKNHMQDNQITKQPNQNPNKRTENNFVYLKKQMHHHSSSEVAFNSFKATHLLFAFYFSHHQFVIMYYLFHKIRQIFF